MLTTPNRTASTAGSPLRRGITLIEMLVVMALISLIVGVSYPSVARGLEGVRLRMAGDDLASFLSVAMNRVEQVEAPLEVRFLRAQRSVEMGGPNTSVKTMKLPDGISFGGIYPAEPGDAQVDRSVLLMPGAPFPRIVIELIGQGGGRRAVRLDPATGTPVIDESPATQAGTAEAQAEAGRK